MGSSVTTPGLRDVGGTARSGEIERSEGASGEGSQFNTFARTAIQTSRASLWPLAVSHAVPMSTALLDGSGEKLDRRGLPRQDPAFDFIPSREQTATALCSPQTGAGRPPRSISAQRARKAVQSRCPSPRSPTPSPSPPPPSPAPPRRRTPRAPAIGFPGTGLP